MRASSFRFLSSAPVDGKTTPTVGDPFEGVPGGLAIPPGTIMMDGRVAPGPQDFPEDFLEGYRTRASCIIQRIPKYAPKWTQVEEDWHHVMKEKYVFYASTMPEPLRKEFADFIRKERFDMFYDGPFVTEDDRARNLRSHDRKLGSTLYLLIKSRTQGWHIPSTYWRSQETLRDTVVRSIITECGAELNCFPTGFVPLAHRIDEYDEQKQNETFMLGEKVSLMGKPLGLIVF